jgi:hypothetical protein
LPIILVVVVLIAPILYALYRHLDSHVLGVLVERSTRGEPFAATSWDPQKLRPLEVPAARDYVLSHPDWTAFHVLLVLRRDYPACYARLSNDVKAAVLCSTLGKSIEFNDWGYLDPAGSYEGISGQCLVETGAAALPYLWPLLDNQRPEVHAGSNRAERLSRRYRVADFAYNYACKLLGLPPKLDGGPEEREREIERLKTELDRRLGKPGTEEESATSTH